MSFSLIPDMSLNSIYDLNPQILRAKGISLLLMDLDNTLISYSESEPSDELKRWMTSFRDQGIDLFLVSNNKTGRAKRFSQVAGLPYLDRAKKPSKKKLIEAMDIMGKRPEQTAMLGDQIFTDVLAANKSGIFSIIITPIDVHKPQFAARYLVEIPFRVFVREKIK